MRLDIVNIRRDTAALCEIGNRFVGSDGERQARDYIFARMRELDLQSVRKDMFEVATYRPLNAKCTLVGAAAPALDCVGLQFMGSDRVEAEAVLIGELSDTADLDAICRHLPPVRGRIAVIKTSYPYLFVDDLTERGALGIVMLGDAPDGYCRNLNAMMYPALVERPNGAHHRIAGVTLSEQSSTMLLAHIAAGGRLRLEHQAEYPIVETGNVIGELPGSDVGEVVVGAHYDTQLDGVGASDNALGIACLLEMMRQLGEHDLRRRVVAVAFADEEAGFRGSADYVQRYGARLAETVGMVNLDALAWAPAQRSLHADPSIMEFAAETAEAAGWLIENRADASLFPGSDHNPFIDAGVPAAFFWRNPPTHPYYHTRGDSLDRIDFQIAVDTASAAAAVVKRLANDPTLPFDRSQPTRRWIDLRP
ncbi:M28 family metallopeptidase [Georhizobium profundi]|nr:M28 family metallopeptidase [Georhizobium profundi]